MEKTAEQEWIDYADQNANSPQSYCKGMDDFKVALKEEFTKKLSASNLQFYLALIDQVKPKS